MTEQRHAAISKCTWYRTVQTIANLSIYWLSLYGFIWLFNSSFLQLRWNQWWAHFIIAKKYIIQKLKVRHTSATIKWLHSLGFMVSFTTYNTDCVLLIDLNSLKRTCFISYWHRVAFFINNNNNKKELRCSKEFYLTKKHNWLRANTLLLFRSDLVNYAIDRMGSVWSWSKNQHMYNRLET